MTDGQTMGISLKLQGFPWNFGDFPKPKPPILGFVWGSCEATIIWPDDWYGNGYIRSWELAAIRFQKALLKMFFLVGCISSMEGNFAFFVCNFLNKNVDQKKRDHYFGCSPVTATTRTIARRRLVGEYILSSLNIFEWRISPKHWCQRNSQEGNLAANARLLKNTFWDHSHNFQKNCEVLHLLLLKKHDDDLENDLDPGNFSEVI